jgi:hypothetical protein
VLDIQVTDQLEESRTSNDHLRGGTPRGPFSQSLMTWVYTGDVKSESGVRCTSVDELKSQFGERLVPFGLFRFKRK